MKKKKNIHHKRKKQIFHELFYAYYYYVLNYIKQYFIHIYIKYIELFYTESGNATGRFQTLYDESIKKNSYFLNTTFAK